MKRIKNLLMGAAAGVLNGLFGAGGGMVMVPLLQSGGMSVAGAHATSIAVMLPLSVASGLLYLSRGHFEITAALPFLPLGLCGAVLGGLLLPRVKGVWLHRVFGVLVIVCGVRLLLQ